MHPSADPRRLLRNAGLVAEEEDPTKASRPFDATRAGFVMSEAACILLLEELESARARGATIYAEVLGYGASNDAHHMAQPEPEATGVAEMMRAALERTGVELERVSPSTRTGPRPSRRRGRDAGDQAGLWRPRLQARRLLDEIRHGALLRAAGAIESMMCALALHHQLVPPTINYRNPDPECDLDYVPNEAREVELDVALSNAMGLGGHNGCVLLGRVWEGLAESRLILRATLVAQGSASSVAPIVSAIGAPCNPRNDQRTPATSAIRQALLTVEHLPLDGRELREPLDREALVAVRQVGGLQDDPSGPRRRRSGTSSRPCRRPRTRRCTD